MLRDASRAVALMEEALDVLDSCGASVAAAHLSMALNTLGTSAEKAKLPKVGPKSSQHAR